MSDESNRKMSIKKILVDPEKRVKAFFLAWVISMIVMIAGYLLIFYFLFWKK